MKSIIKLFFIAIVFQNISCLAFDDTKLQEAQSYYQQGLNSKTLFQRKLNFNKALGLYLEIENIYGESSENLFESIGNNFYQVNEFAWAILYYHRVLSINPSNASVEQRLKLAQNKLGLPPTFEPNAMNRILSLNNIFPLSRRIVLLFFVTIISFIVCSIAIWFSGSFWKKLSAVMLGFEALLVVNLILTMYFSPLEGIIVNPTGLFQATDMNQPQITATPLVKGIKVKIIETQKEGNWLKILNPEGTVGFVPAGVVEII
ncbi:MAG: SH3 domain-containing protein [Parachlamydiaceae bacterium]|nr:SH3 domain-containing protein [Parachlamydiaceae bacterium]